jgi:hypothetical protein
MSVDEKIKNVYGLTKLEYNCLVTLGESPGYLKEASLFDKHDLQLMAQSQNLIKKGFLKYNYQTKEFQLTDKGREVWNLED